MSTTNPESVSLTDVRGRPLRDLRISVTDRCNLRCTYCMPAEVYDHHYQHLPRQDILRFEEIVRLARLFVQLGVKKIRLTGGEPLLRKNLDQLVAQLAAIDGVEDIALTTNGTLLSEQAQRLKQAGLGRITVSLDSLDEKLFREIVGREVSVTKVLEGIEQACRVGFFPIKINVVVQRGKNDHQVLDLLEHFRGSGHIVRFIEYMDVGNQNDWAREEVVSSAKLLEVIGAKWPVEPVRKTRPGEVADRYRFSDGAGEIGFISSVSAPFCAGCNRARLSSDGKVYTCLFAVTGHDLKQILRDGASDETLLVMMRSLWQGREDHYSQQRFEKRLSGQEAPAKVEMYQIGG